MEECFRPTYLIDVRNACIVEGFAAQDEYVALSYQWGQALTFRSSTQDLGQLLRTGALSKDVFGSQLAPTVRDAIAVVNSLGYRYLWVDALCIVQDCQEHVSTEISRMHQIYAHASFTIVVTEGSDANVGLRGFEGATSPRQCEQLVHDLEGQENVSISRRTVAEASRQSTYYSRAWTYQEELLSRRKLLFWEGGVEWWCGEGMWDEGTIPNLEHWSYSDATSPHQFSKLLPTCGSLDDILWAYNVRDLRFPEDAFPAFAGAQAILNDICPSGLVYGLPIFWFDIALLWTLESGRPDYNLQRRVRSGVTRPGSTGFGLPSWSWIGWVGSVKFPRDDELDGYIGALGFTEPTTSWYSIDSPTSTEREPIRSAWHEYRMKPCDEVQDMLPGWTCVLPGYLNHMRNQNKSYRYQFPVPDLQTSKADITPQQNAYLFARVHRAYVFVGEFLTFSYFSGKRQDVHNRQVWLTDANGDRVGRLNLHEARDHDFPGTRVEVVAVCKGYDGSLLEIYVDPAEAADTWIVPSTGLPLWWPDQGPEPTKDPNMQCYFVLWIEWVDGVAYRKASGTLLASAWEDLRETELVDLILG
ncbi:hypothetical protein NX059_005081 [Plenodomus lindquistii]|nr:hypothetical protein NX059_005081 [Plenodomus lindquistii]